MSMSMILHPFSGGSSGGGKSALKQWYEKIGGGQIVAQGSGLRRVTETANVVRAVGESAVVGAFLGGFEAIHGSLDVPIPGTVHEVPVDGALALVAGGAAIAMADEPIAMDLRNAAATGASIWGYRKGKEFIVAKQTAARIGTSKVSGDPVVEASRHL